MKIVKSLVVGMAILAVVGLVACSPEIKQEASQETIARSQQNSAAVEEHVVPNDKLGNSTEAVHVSLPTAINTQESSSASSTKPDTSDEKSSSSSSSKDSSSSSSASTSREKDESDKSKASSDAVGKYFDNSAGGTKIMGKSAATIDDMVELYEQMGRPYPSDVLSKGGAPTIKDFCTIIARESAEEGVRADVVFVQSMHETGWLQFGNQVSVEQFNFAGIGAVDSGGEGAHFKSVDEGIRAQVQHLKAYASTDNLKNDCVDPRFDLVSRGCAPEIQDLSQRWASGPTYGDTLQTKVDELDAMS